MNHRMRRKTRCVLVVLRGHHQLREARNHGEATADGARPVSRDASRQATMQADRSHVMPHGYASYYYVNVGPMPFPLFPHVSPPLLSP